MQFSKALAPLCNKLKYVSVIITLESRNVFYNTKWTIRLYVYDLNFKVLLANFDWTDVICLLKSTLRYIKVIQHTHKKLGYSFFFIIQNQMIVLNIEKIKQVFKIYNISWVKITNTIVFVNIFNFVFNTYAWHMW